MTDTTIDEGGVGGPVVTLVRFGGSAGERIVALPEEPASTSTVVKEALPARERALQRRVDQLRPDGRRLGSAHRRRIDLAPRACRRDRRLPHPAPWSLSGRSTPRATSSPSRWRSPSASSSRADRTPCSRCRPRSRATRRPSSPWAIRPIRFIRSKGSSARMSHPPARRTTRARRRTRAATQAVSASAVVATCQPTEPPALAVDTFNVSLYGANAPYDRRQAQATCGADRGARRTLMCLLEV